jgi:uncharacterized protein YlxW (UPF0749 family)
MPARQARVLDRVGALLHAPAHRDAPEQSPRAEVEDLRERVERLEAMVEDLQDALYRHAKHEDSRIGELQRRTHVVSRHQP